MGNIINFVKMHGIGNDYVYVDTFEQAEPACGWPEFAKQVSDRHFGIGGDGLILIEPPKSTDATGTMRMFNADGSESEMCGNGLRCVGKYLHDHRAKGQTSMKVDTGAGLLGIEIIEKDGQNNANQLEINMGPPILKAADIPCTSEAGGKTETLEVDGQIFEYIAVSMGNPHCVIFVDNVDTFPVETIGPKIENNTDLFPNRVNIEFIEVISRTEAKQRTWERGSGETYACGTGASAVAVAGQLSGRFDSEVLIHLLGGDLRLRWQGEGRDVFMCGGATHVFSGTYEAL